MSAPELPTELLRPAVGVSEFEIASAMGAARLIKSIGGAPARAAAVIERDCTRAMAAGLMRAALLGDTGAAGRMLDGGVDPNATDESGRTPLIAAASNPSGRNDIMCLLCSYGADVDAADELGINAVAWAAISGPLTHISELVNLGANVSAADKKGNTALMHAARMGRADSAALLIRLGAPLRRSNKAGYTARDLARDKPAVLAILL